MKQLRKWKWHYGNKSFVMTMDAIIAVIIVILFLSFANLFFLKGQQSSAQELQMIKYGSDVVRILDSEQLFDEVVLLGGNFSIVSNRTQNISLKNYQMKFAIVDFGKIGNITEEDIPIPQDRFIGGGEYVIAVTNTTNNTIKSYNRVRYWIWLK